MVDRSCLAEPARTNPSVPAIYNAASQRRSLAAY